MTNWLESARGWLSRRHRDRLTAQFGGTQNCPWCKQCAQDGPGWNFKPWDQNPILDVLTCGVCRGTSVWMWGPLFLFVGSLHPPIPEGDAMPELMRRPPEAAQEDAL